MISTTRATARYLGFGIVAAALGGAALALHPAFAGQALAAFNSVVICNGSQPCNGGTNQGIGAGVKGISLRGNGVAGQTNVANSRGNGHAGIYGLDASTVGNFNSGVLGLSRNGFGVVGQSSNNNGTEGFTSCSICSGVYGESDNASFGVAGRSAVGGGIGVVGDGGPSGIGMQARVGTVASGTDVIEGLDGNFTTVFRLDDLGNIHITGDVIPDGHARTGAKHVGSYSSRSSVPTIEDFGEATLRNGGAYVALDSSFANVIDGRSSYVVFLTPEGDNDGLYVTGRTLRGFEVHEARGGHSTLSFAYRILARPYGDNARRLPVVEGVRHSYPRLHG
jgi:hypothetical protein